MTMAVRCDATPSELLKNGKPLTQGSLADSATAGLNDAIPSGLKHDASPSARGSKLRRGGRKAGGRSSGALENSSSWFDKEAAPAALLPGESARDTLGTKAEGSSAQGCDAGPTLDARFNPNSEAALRPARGSPDPQRVQHPGTVRKFPALASSQRAAALERRAPRDLPASEFGLSPYRGLRSRFEPFCPKQTGHGAKSPKNVLKWREFLLK